VELYSLSYGGANLLPASKQHKGDSAYVGTERSSFGSNKHSEVRGVRLCESRRPKSLIFLKDGEAAKSESKAAAKFSTPRRWVFNRAKMAIGESGRLA
jgi:hypothetical protein